MASRKELIEAYLKRHNYELTMERKVMIAIVCDQIEFDMEKFVKECARRNISQGTAYNFKNTLLDCKVIIRLEYGSAKWKPCKFNEEPPLISEILLQVPKNLIAHNYVAERIRKSHN